MERDQIIATIEQLIAEEKDYIAECVRQERDDTPYAHGRIAGLQAALDVINGTLLATVHIPRGKA